jgi:hypothetical protein
MILEPLEYGSPKTHLIIIATPITVIAAQGIKPKWNITKFYWINKANSIHNHRT